MRAAWLLTGLTVLSCVPAPLRAQGLLARPTAQHATVAAASSADTVAAGGRVTLFADVTPHPRVHIYAAGAKDFTPVTLVPTPNPSVQVAAPQYPKPGTVVSPGTIEAVPAYSQPFRVALPVTLAKTAKPGERVTVGGALTYQACDDTLCYPVSTAGVTWTLTVK